MARKWWKLSRVKNLKIKRDCFFKNEQGVSLVSVTIAAGLMGVLAVFMMRMQENNLKVQNDMSTRNEMNLFMTKLNNYLSRGDYCLANLKGRKVSEGGQLQIEELVAPNGRTLYKVGEKYGNNHFILKQLEQGDFFYDTKDKDGGILTLIAHLEKTKKAYGAKVMKKKIDLMVRLGKNSIIEGCGSSGIGGGASHTSGISAETIHKAVEGTMVPGNEESAKVEEVKKIIENNPSLKQMHESIQNIKKTNKQFEKMWEDQNQ